MSLLRRSIDDFDEVEVDRILNRANGFRTRESLPTPPRVPPTVGLAFLEASLRTRVGFAVAAARLGWGSVEVDAPRSGPTSQPEPWTETLRVLSGMVDVVVARPGCRLEPETTERWTVSPVLNGGDVGPDAEHPTQALVDLFAIQSLVGPVNELKVALCGDLRMRSARSFIRLLARRPPASLVVVTDRSLEDGLMLPPELGRFVERRTLGEVEDLDVISAVGIPDGATYPAVRRRLQVDSSVMDRLPPHAAVLSPMPVLDEVETAALGNPRVRIYEQSDLAVNVRMAVLEEVFKPADGPVSDH